MSKVRFGLSRLKRAKLNRAEDGTITFGTPVDMPGAVSFSLTREGGEPVNFYADNGIYHKFPGTNGGYKAELVVARVDDATRSDILGETFDEASGGYYETTDDKAPEFAYIMEMETDQEPVAYVFYDCVASRIEVTANTINESPSVDTDTISLAVSAAEFTIGGVKKRVVQEHIAKKSDNAEKFEAFFEGVVMPGSAAAGNGD